MTAERYQHIQKDITYRTLTKIDYFHNVRGQPHHERDSSFEKPVFELLPTHTHTHTYELTNSCVY